MKINKRNLIIGLAGLTATLILHYLFFAGTVYFYESDLKKFGGKQDTIVVKPLLTALAYSDGGFYDYYKGNCDQKCLTIAVNNKTEYKPHSSSLNSVITLEALKYNFITDYDIYKDPTILEKYDRVILLHSEYVTGEMFMAITSHPNVIYLYPNALYAQVSIEDDKMTLIRGHNYENGQYPVPIDNGFGWKYNNKDEEYDTKCKTWQFKRIENGYQLNCWPTILLKDKQFLYELSRVSTKSLHCFSGEWITWPDSCKSLK